MSDLTSKQRAQLRGLANGIDTILIVGKDGIGENLVKQANDALLVDTSDMDIDAVIAEIRRIVTEKVGA